MATKVVKYEDLYGYKDVIEVIKGTEGYEEGWYTQEIEMDYGDGKKLADVLALAGYDVKYDEDEVTWYLEKEECHWTDCYWYPYERSEY